MTCHDLDTFRSVLDPEIEPRSAWFRAMTRHILAGLRKAGHIACDSHATRDALVARLGIAAERTTVVPNGPHPSCSPEAEPAADVEAARLLGPRGVCTELLHVGSTIARKRIDVLLDVFAALRRSHDKLRLTRVGGPFTAAQQARVRELGLTDAIVVLPMLDRATLAAVYRRSALLLMPSEREGFGLPVLEALACGTPVVASDIEALREVGGFAASYCPVEGIEDWQRAVGRLLIERLQNSSQWNLRRETGIRRAAAFSWSKYAANVASIYTAMLDGTVGGQAAEPRHFFSRREDRLTVLRVLHVGKFYPPVTGGIERVVQSVCHATRGRIDNRVLAFHTGPATVDETVEGVPVTRVGDARRRRQRADLARLLWPAAARATRT